MKSPLIIVITLITSILISCNTTSKESNTDDAAKKNLAAVNSINKAVETGDVSTLGDYIAADAIDHSDINGDVKGFEKIKANLSQLHLTAHDLKVVIKKELADSEYVFQWKSETGTATTTDMGVAIGQPFTVTDLGVSKFKNGKVVEYWEFMQPAEMMKLMNPMKEPVNKADSVSHH